MNTEDMRKILGSHNDFKFEKTRVENFLHQKGHRVLCHSNEKENAADLGQNLVYLFFLL